MHHMIQMVLCQRALLVPPPHSLRIVVAIPTIGRKAILAETLPQISRQTRQPEEVVICVVSEKDIDRPPLAELPFPVRVLNTSAGLCHQRNCIIENCPEADILVFLDDDFLMERSYLARAEQLFSQMPDIAMATGRVLADGILGPGISVSEGAHMLELHAKGELTEDSDIRPVYNAYGCNMAVRMSVVRQGNIRFDENLPFYGWLEDVDFSRLTAGRGRIVKAEGLRGVHLGIKMARSPGVRLGYSQIANPVYLMGKHTMTFRHAAFLMSRNMLANLARAFHPEPWVDRRGRLKGNLKALGDLVTGRLAPGKIVGM